MAELFLARYVYAFVLALLAIGLYGMFVKRDLAKKIIGMTIFTTAIYLFFIEASVKDDAGPPVIDPDVGVRASAYVDPLPHLLILTAIVVGVGIVGVALALMVRIHRTHGTLDEEVVVARLSRGDPPVTTVRGVGRAHLPDDEVPGATRRPGGTDHPWRGRPRNRRGRGPDDGDHGGGSGDDRDDRGRR